MAKSQNYIQYLKDNPQGYWFKRKLYGWGWVPAKWQGWAVIVVFAILIWLNALSLQKHPSGTDIFWFIARFVGLLALLAFVCYGTGESLNWQWGSKK